MRYTKHRQYDVNVGKKTSQRRPQLVLILKNVLVDIGAGVKERRRKRNIALDPLITFI